MAGSNAARSPAFQPVTPGPTRTTTPAGSCPTTPPRDVAPPPPPRRLRRTNARPSRRCRRRRCGLAPPPDRDRPAPCPPTGTGAIRKARRRARSWAVFGGRTAHGQRRDVVQHRVEIGHVALFFGHVVAHFRWRAGQVPEGKPLRLNPGQVSPTLGPVEEDVATLQVARQVLHRGGAAIVVLSHQDGAFGV